MSELENQDPLETADAESDDSPAPEVVATEAAPEPSAEVAAEPIAEAGDVDAAPIEPAEAEAPDSEAEPETSESPPEPGPEAAAVPAETPGSEEARAEDDAAAVSASADAELAADVAEEVQAAEGSEETAAEEADEADSADPVADAPAVEEADLEQADGVPQAAEVAPAEAAEQEAADGADTEAEAADAVEADQEAAEEAAEAPKPAGVPGIDWYIIHTYSGFENKVKESLRTRADAFGFADRIGEILIPTEDVVEMRNGKKVTSKRLLYPGYVLLQLKMDDELWHVVKNTPRVTGFVGGDPSPTPLTADEVNQILHRQTASKEKPRPKMSFEHNDRVKIIDGPFTNFTGTVEEINPDRSTLKVMVTIFGRGTPVELEYFQVEKERI